MIVYLLFLHILVSPSYSQILYNYAGNGSSGYAGDNGAATEARLNYPTATFMDQEGNLYIADTTNDVIRKVSPNGLITTYAGNGVWGFSGDGGPAVQASFKNPTGIWIDSAGNLYIADLGNHRVRKVSPEGEINTIAGNGTPAFSADGGLAVETAVAMPYDVYVNPAGEVYVTELGKHRVRKIALDGTISTVAGTGNPGYSGDNDLAVDARLKYPIALCGDAEGNLYVSDFGNNCIRKIDTQGIITTIAGTTRAAYSGDGGFADRASLNQPRDIYVASDGTLYLADASNHVIRSIDSNGIIHTIAGTGREGSFGDGGEAKLAAFSTPSGVFVDNLGHIYISDRGNHKIRRIYSVVTVKAGADATIGYGESHNLSGRALGGSGTYTFEWKVLSGPDLYNGQFSSHTQTNTLFTPTSEGNYLLQLTARDSKGGQSTDTVVVTVTAPFSVEAGPSLFAFAGEPVKIPAQSRGGGSSYEFNWSILSGPVTNASQFNSPDALQPYFTPSNPGTYILRIEALNVDEIVDEDTTTVVVLGESNVSRVIVTDTLDTLEDLSNGTDGDPSFQRELVVRWIFSPSVVNLALIGEIHIYVSVDGGSFEFLHKSVDLANQYYEWNDAEDPDTNALFQNGPEFNKGYLFQIYLFTKSGSPLFYGPYENAGPVTLFDDGSVEFTATPTLAPIVPPEDTPTVQPTATVTNTPVAGEVDEEPTSTPTIVVIPTTTLVSTPSAIPIPSENPTEVPTATPIATPVEDTPTPDPTNTPDNQDNQIPDETFPTPADTATETPIPVDEATPTHTFITLNPTGTPVPDPSQIPSVEPTETAIPKDRSPTSTPSVIPINTPTDTPTSTPGPGSGGPQNTRRPEESNSPTPTTEPVTGNDPTETPIPVIVETPSPTPVVDIPVDKDPTATSVPDVENQESPTPTETPVLIDIPTPIDPTPIETPSLDETPVPESTPSPDATSPPDENEPTATPTLPDPVITQLPVDTPTVTATPTVTVTPTVTATSTPSCHRYAYPFDSSLEAERFTVFPEHQNFTVSSVPVESGNEDATDGRGVVGVDLPVRQLYTLNGPTLAVYNFPIRITAWFRVPSDAFAFGLGAYVSNNGEDSGAAYTLRFKPELKAGVWQKAEIIVTGHYTEMTPFMVFYNDGTEPGTVYADNLRVYVGEVLPPGEPVDLGDWQSNLFLNGRGGVAVIQSNTFGAEEITLTKEVSDDASRMVAGYQQSFYPNRVTVKIDVVKEYGQSGTFTLWLGNGASTFEQHISLQALPQNQTVTVSVGGVTFEPGVPMFVVFQTAGEDRERVHVRNVRIVESDVDINGEYCDYCTDCTPTSESTGGDSTPTPVEIPTPTVTATLAPQVGESTTRTPRPTRLPNDSPDDRDNGQGNDFKLTPTPSLSPDGSGGNNGGNSGGGNSGGEESLDDHDQGIGNDDRDSHDSGSGNDDKTDRDLEGNN